MKTKAWKKHDYGNVCIVEFETDDMSVLNAFPAGYYMEKGLCRAGEQKEEQVGNVLIENRSSDYLLFTDMDILVGAKQNRVVNISTLVKPHSESNLEVSCVEQHRWDTTGHGFRPSERTMEPDLRCRKVGNISSKVETRRYRSELQCEIWGEIQKRISPEHSFNPTANYALYLHEEEQSRQRGSLPSFQPDTNCNGLAIFRDGKPLLIEIFGNTALYQYYFRRIIDHFLHSAGPKRTDPLSEGQVRRIIEKETGMCRFFPSVPGKNGTGDLWMMAGEEKQGFELGFGGERVHEVVFFGG